MARLVNQKFEGTGYDNSESWTEAVGSGCTINEDAATSDVGSPTDWGSQCCKIIQAASVTNYTYIIFGEAAIRYSRVEIVPSAVSLGDGGIRGISMGWDGTASKIAWMLLYYRSSSTYYFAMNWCLDGTNTTSSQGPSISIGTNTKYRIEVRWDKTNNVADWKVDGTSYGTQTIAAGGIQQGLIGLGTTDTGTGTHTSYYDLVAVDTSWIGAESAGNLSIWASECVAGEGHLT